MENQIKNVTTENSVLSAETESLSARSRKKGAAPRRSGGKPKAGSARVALVAGIVAIMLIVAMVSVTYSWFFSKILEEGVVATTGQIDITFRSYKAINSQDPTDPLTHDALARYINSTGDTGSVQLTSGLARNVGRGAVTTGTGSEIVSVNDETYFVIERDPSGIPLDLRLTFDLVGLIKNSDGTVSTKEENLRMAGGFWYRVEEVTEDVLGKTPDETTKKYNYENGSGNSITNYSLDGASEIEKKLYSYINDASNKVTYLPAFDSPLDTIGNNVSESTTLRTGNYCVYRLTCGLKDLNAVQYNGLQFEISVNLASGQVGGFNDSAARGTYYVSNEAELRSALNEYLPGDSIVLTDSIDYSTDLVFTRPVNLYINKTSNPNKLIVRGNLIFTYPYGGQFTVNTLYGSQIFVRSKSNGAGGDLIIDTPNSSFTFNGTYGSGDLRKGDVFVEWNFVANASCPSLESNYDKDESGYGLTISNSRIASGTGIGEFNGELKTITLQDNTQLTVAGGTEVGAVFAQSAAVQRIQIINYGTIGRPSEGQGAQSHANEFIDLSSMTIDVTGETYTQFRHIPQIYISNYGTISQAIRLPVYSTPFIKSTDPATGEPVYSGNTRIICQRTANDFHISDNSPNFTDDDIEHPNANTYVIDVLGDGTDLIVYYTKFEGSTEDLSLGEILDRFAAEKSASDPLYSNYTLADVEKITMYTGATKTLLAADYDYLRDPNRSGARFGSLVTLNLDYCTTENNTIPANAFQGMTALEELTLPRSTVTLGDNMVANTSVVNLYLPEGVASTTSIQLTGVKYVHPLRSVIVPGMYENGRYYFVSAPLLQTYRDDTNYGKRSGDSTVMMHIFEEAIYYKELDLFHRPVSYNETEIACYVGIPYPESGSKLNPAQTAGSVAFNLLTMQDGGTRNVVGIDDYAFYDKIHLAPTTLEELRFNIEFNSRLLTIGDYAFYNCYGIKSAKISGVSADIAYIGKEAFSECWNSDTSIYKGLESFVIEYSNAKSTGCTVGDKAFYNCQAAVTLVLPGVVSVGNNTFENCYKAETITVTDLKTAGDEAFKNCSSVRYLSSVYLTSVGKACFENASKLVVAHFPALYQFGTVTANTYNTFKGCSSLTLVETAFPSTAGHFGSAFRGAENSLKLWIIHPENTPENVTTAIKLFDNTNLNANDKNLFYVSGSTGSVVTDFRIVTTSSTDNDAQISYAAKLTNLGNFELVDIGPDFSTRNLVWMDKLAPDNDAVPLNVNEYNTNTDYSNNFLVAYNDDNSSAIIVTTLTGRLTGTPGSEPSEYDFTIPASVTIGSRAYNFIRYNKWAFYYTAWDNTNLTAFSDFITVFQSYSFGHNGGLLSANFVNLPSSTPLQDRAFIYNYSIKSVSLANAGSFGEYAFGYCTSLESINAPDVTQIGQYCFTNCTSLPYVEFPALIKTGLYAFQTCSSLVVAKLPKLYDFSYVRNAMGTFEGCTCLAVVETAFPKIDSEVGQYYTISTAFKGCNNSLLAWIIHAENTPSSVYSYLDLREYYEGRHLFGNLAYGNHVENYFRVVISGFAYVNKESYANRIRPQGTNIEVVNTGSYLLGSEDGTQSYMIWADANPSENVIPFTNIGPEGNQKLSDYGYGDYLYVYDPDTNKAELVTVIAQKIHTSYSIPRTVTSGETTRDVVTAASYACASTVYEDNTVITIDGTNLKSTAVGTFYKRTGIVTVLDNDQCSDFVPGNSMFYGCTDLTTLTLNHVKTLSSYMFYNCTKLPHTGIWLPEATSFGNFTFALGTFTLFPESICPKLESCGNSCFANCKSLTEFRHTKLQIIGANCFEGCSVLNFFETPAVTKAGTYAFKDCSSLVVAKLPKLYDFSYERNAMGTFEGCTCLAVVETAFPKIDGEVGQYYTISTAFKDCNNSLLAWIIHAENTPSSVYSYLDLREYYAGRHLFGDLAYGDHVENYFRVVISGFAHVNKESYASRIRPRETNIEVVNTGSYLLGSEDGTQSYMFWSDVGPSENVVPFRNIGANGNQKLSDYECGDYLYVYDPDTNKAELVTVIAQKIHTLYSIPQTVTSDGTTYDIVSAASYACVSTVYEDNTVITIDGTKLKSTRDHVFYNRSGIVSVLDNSQCSDFVPGSYMFAQCPDLETVTLNYIETLSDYMFYSVRKLKDDNLIISNAKSCGNYCFANCVSLTEFINPGIRTIGEHCFENCSSLTFVKLPEVYKAGRYAFQDCSSLVVAKLPKLYDFCVVSDVLGHFANCYALTVVETSYPWLKAITYNHYNMQSVFKGCQNSLKAWIIHAENFPEDTDLAVQQSLSLVPSFGHAQCYIFGTASDGAVCQNDFRIIVSGFGYSNRSTFANSIITKYGDYQVFYEVVNTGSYLLGSLDGTQSYMIWSDVPEDVNGDLLENVVPYRNLGYGDDGLGDGKKLSDYECGDYLSVYDPLTGRAELVTVFADRIYDNYSIPRTVTSGGDTRDVVTTASNAFVNTKFVSGTVITIDGTNLKSTGNNTFYGKTGIVAVVDNDQCANFVAGDSMFSGCPEITTVTLNYVEHLGNSMFANCTELPDTAISLPSATSLGASTFAGCKKIEHFPQSIAPNLESCGDNCFQYCSKLSEFVHSNITKIGDYCFSGCSSITNVNLPELINVGKYAFQNCTSLVVAKLPKTYEFNQNGNVTLATFENCTSMVIVETAFPLLRASYGNYNLPSVFSKCQNNLKGWIIHCENTPESVSVNTLSMWGYWGHANCYLFGAADPGENCKSDFRIVISGFKHPNKPLYATAFSMNNPNNTPLPIEVINTGEYLSSSYLWADSGSTSVLSQYGCGDYLYVIDQDGNARIISCFKDKIEGQYSVPSSLGGHNVASLGQMSFMHTAVSSGTSVQVSPYVTSIGASAFERTGSGLSSVTLPDSVTDLGSNAFKGCNSLTKMVLESMHGAIAATDVFGASNQGPAALKVWVYAYAYENFYTASDWGGIPRSKFSIFDTKFVNPADNVIYYLLNYREGYLINYIDISSLASTTLTMPAAYNDGSTSKNLIAVGATSFVQLNTSGITRIVLPEGLQEFHTDFSNFPTTLSEFAISGSNTAFTVIDGVLYSKDEKTLVCYPRGKANTQFAIPSAVDYLSSGAFTGCVNLAEVRSDRGLVIAGSSFVNCPQLTKLVLSAANPGTLIGTVTFSGMNEDFRIYVRIDRLVKFLSSIYSDNVAASYAMPYVTTPGDVEYQPDNATYGACYYCADNSTYYYLNGNPITP